ncbi:hypothetical protein WJX84_009511, partial [Apatococcus fuscideae]
EVDSRTMLSQAESLAGLVEQGGGPDLVPYLTGLRQGLQDSAVEARNFAAQQRADVERTKRTSAQAGLMSPGGSEAGLKRMREAPTPAGLTNGSAHPAEQTAAMETSMEDDDERGLEEGTSASSCVNTSGPGSFEMRAKFIPLRLTLDERRLLRLLEAALSVSEYTDKVDVLAMRSKVQRVHLQIKDICAILSGLVVAQNYKKGQQLITDRSFKDNAPFFQECFELGRRYKVMNPDRMRSEYGKLVYMLMDSADTEIQDLLEFKCVRPLRTVHRLLEEGGGLAMLQDAHMSTATAEIVAGDRPRHEVQRDIKNKERARSQLARKYKNSRLSEDDILRCLYSISDNNSYLLFNRDPVDRMLEYLRSYFTPSSPDPEFSLAIQGGASGARLTHNHERQYNFVLQSLTLWREISHDMFQLWCTCDDDLLQEGNYYRLSNTGQGLNRVQQAPKVMRLMLNILGRCQRRIGNWVGSSVIHLGDHNVPNALMLIDKYTQVPRILNPVVLVLDALPRLTRDPQLRAYIDKTFGGVERCRRGILADFFKHAFDGSGADSFFDAGSCIDGRLTSAWNWGSKVEKKTYYPVFKLAGFTGFDGDFK